MKKFKEPSTSILVKTEGGYTMSVYKGELTKDCIAQQTLKIRSAFSGLDDGFYDIFFDQIKQMGFSNERLVNSVNHVIRTCEYPQPTIAKFLSYDQHIKLYTYDQYTNLDGKAHYKSVRISEAVKPYWAHLNDIEKYKLKLWNE